VNLHTKVAGSFFPNSIGVGTDADFDFSMIILPISPGKKRPVKDAIPLWEGGSVIG
jgi:hypothetical protein